MTAGLTEEWVNSIAEFSSILPSENFSITLQYEISGAPEGKVRYYVIFEEGKVTEAKIGKHSSPDCLISSTFSELVSILERNKAVTVSFIQGNLKVEGEYERYLLEMSSIRSTQEWGSMLKALREKLSP